MKIRLTKFVKTFPFMESNKKEFIQISGTPIGLPKYNEAISNYIQKEFDNSIAGDFSIKISKSNTEKFDSNLNGILSFDTKQKIFSLFFLSEVSDADWVFFNDLCLNFFGDKEIYIELEEIGANHHNKHDTTTEFKVQCRSNGVEVITKLDK